MSMSNFKQDKEIEARDALVVTQKEAFKRFLENNRPEIRFGTALVDALRAYMLDAFLTATDEDFEYALQNIDTRYLKQRVQTPEEVKAALIDKIVELLQATNNKHWQVPNNVKTERSKMAFWSLEELNTRLGGIVRAQTLNARPITELRQTLVNARQYQGYPQLGKTVVRPGTVKAVALDAAYLRGLDVWELKKYTRLYGVEQINARLRGE